MDGQRNIGAGHAVVAVDEGVRHSLPDDALRILPAVHAPKAFQTRRRGGVPSHEVPGLIDKARSLTKATKSPATLDLLKGDSDSFEWFRRRSRSFRHLIDSKDFPDIADELRQADHWHGLTRQKAFEKAKMTSAYNLEYAASSIFVHGSNVEHDFAEPGATGIRFKPLVQRDPARTLTQLGRATHSLVDIYRLIWEDCGKPQYQESFTVEVEGGESFDVDALVALANQALHIFPNPRSKSAP